MISFDPNYLVKGHFLPGWGSSMGLVPGDSAELPGCITTRWKRGYCNRVTDLSTADSMTEVPFRL